MICFKKQFRSNLIGYCDQGKCLCWRQDFLVPHIKMYKKKKTNFPLCFQTKTTQLKNQLYKSWHMKNLTNVLDLGDAIV